MIIGKNSICQYDRRLVVLTNMPTPYRTQFFNRLQIALNSARIGFAVLFCAVTESHRHWAFVPKDVCFDYKILHGLHPRFARATFHFNPSVSYWLWKWRPTWVLSAGAWFMPTGILVLGALRRTKAVCLFWTESHEDRVTYPGGLVARLRRFVLRAYDGFAVPNKKSAAFLASELGRSPKTITLPNTVDDTFFIRPTRERRLQARSAKNLKLDDIVVVQVANLEDWKGVRELVAGWTEAARVCPKLLLALLGEGKLGKELRSTYAEAIRQRRLLFVGAVPPYEVREWLYAADAFVLASKRDSNPLSVIEAALTGLPILLSKKAGNFNELCLDGVTGMAISTIKPPAVALTLQRFSALTQLERSEMGRHSFENARQHFTTDNVIAEVISSLSRF